MNGGHGVTIESRQALSVADAPDDHCVRIAAPDNIDNEAMYRFEAPAAPAQRHGKSADQRPPGCYAVLATVRTATVPGSKAWSAERINNRRTKSPSGADSPRLRATNKWSGSVETLAVR